MCPSGNASVWATPIPAEAQAGAEGTGRGACRALRPSQPSPDSAFLGRRRRRETILCRFQSDLAPGLPGLLYPTLPERQRSDPNGPRPRVGTPRGRLPLRAARLLPHQPRGPRRRAAGASQAASPPPRSTGAELVALGTRIKMQICIPVLSLPSSFSVISPGTPHSPAAPKCPCSWGPMAQGLRNKGKRSPRTTRKALAELLARRAGGPHFCSASGLWEPQAS